MQSIGGCVGTVPRGRRGPAAVDDFILLARRDCCRVDVHRLRLRVGTIPVDGRSSWCISPWLRAYPPHDFRTRDAVRGIRGDETDVCNLTANLSTAGFAEDDVLGLSVPFGGCSWARDADDVDLSEDAGVASTAFFLSAADCGGIGVEGRGEGAAAFCNSRLAWISLPTLGWPITLDSPFAGAQRCSRFLRLAWYLVDSWSDVT